MVHDNYDYEVNVIKDLLKAWFQCIKEIYLTPWKLKMFSTSVRMINIYRELMKFKKNYQW